VLNSKAYPYPEIVTGEKWEVVGTINNSPDGSTDNLNRQMTVPLDRECTECGINHSRMIRRHELGHAKWSPKTMGKLKPGVRAEAVHVLEEVRVNHLLYENKLALSEPSKCLDVIEQETMKLVYESGIAEIILMGLASRWKVPEIDTNRRYVSYKYNDEWIVMQACFNMIRNDDTVTDYRKQQIIYAERIITRFFQSITNHGYGQTISYRKVQKYAEPLSAILDMFRDAPTQDEVYKPKPKPNTAPGMDESEGEAQESNELGGGSLEQRTRDDLADLLYRSTQGTGRWGEMFTHQPPLSVNLQSRLKNGRSYRPADFGYNPKYINRYCIDKKIFKQKMTALGGTILIDASGSMSFNGEDILEVMQQLPAVTIAMYNGTGDTGNLRIIAKNGKRVTEKYLDNHSGYGNVVDGPALEWLGTQPAKRIWVSDMHVFGAHGDTAGFNLMADVNKIVRKYNIINLKNIEEVKEHALKLNVV
tara:strand:+ start:3255 stop:4682 length:1428 start_codon:yes stop_codon:yes gene_type:complete